VKFHWLFLYYIELVEENHLKYLMRVGSHFLKAVDNAPKEDQVIEVNKL